MIWETNGRYFQRDESGTKRISEARYKEFSAEKSSESKPDLSLSIPSFEISEEERAEYARSFKEDKDEIRSVLRKRLEARGFEYTNGVPMSRKSEPEPQEIEFEIDFDEEDFCDAAEEFEDEEEEFEIDFEEEDYEPTPGPPPEKISPEIYDALDNLGAASIPDNNYSLSEIKALTQRLNQLLGREKC